MTSAPTQPAAPIEFWFDFASGYAYFAALEIEDLAERHGRTVIWRPFTLGTAFKVTGAQGLSRTPLKREYAQRDWHRLARLKRVQFNLPEQHPRVGLPGARPRVAIRRRDATPIPSSAALLFSMMPSHRSAAATRDEKFGADRTASINGMACLPRISRAATPLLTREVISIPIRRLRPAGWNRMLKVWSSSPDT